MTRMIGCKFAFLIGAQKSGTSFVTKLLRQSPSVFIPEVSEPNYFALNGKRPNFKGPGDEETINKLSIFEYEKYRRLYDKGGARQLAFDCSTLYLYSNGAPKKIYEMHPDAKLLAVLRNPVDRAYSAYCHLKRDGRECDQSFESALSKETLRIKSGYESLWHYVNVGYYYKQLLRYYELFPENSIRIVLFEELINSPTETMRNISRHFGLPPIDNLIIPGKVNSSGKPRLEAINRLAHSSGKFKEVLKAVLPKRLQLIISSVHNHMNLSPFPPLESKLREELYMTYDNDIRELQSLTGVDCSVWKKN